MIRGSTLSSQLLINLLLWSFTGAILLLMGASVFSIYPLVAAAMLFLGILAGVGFGSFVEKRQLRIIEAQGQYRISARNTLSAIILIVGSAIVFMALTSLFFADFWRLPREIGGLALLFMAPINPANLLAERYYLKKWEAKEGKLVLTEQGLFASSVYVVSHPPPAPPSN